MKRSLVLLLVVAILAMMMPSFALAEDPVPTMTLSATTATVGLRSDEYWTNLGIAATVTVPEDNYMNGHLRVSSNNYNVISTDDSDYTYWYNGGTYELPSMEIRGEGKATINVQLWDSYEDELYASQDIAVEVKKIATEKIELDPNTKVTDLEMKVGEIRSFEYCFIASPADCYYGSDFKWTCSDATLARIDKYGNVQALKEGTITLTATAKDNNKATAEAKITIKPADKQEDPTAPTLTFTTSTFTVKSGESLGLNNYLLVENPVDDDEIIWTSSNPQTVNVGSNGYIRNYMPDTVTITARSMLFPTAIASCTVTYEKEKLESISFSAVPTSVKYGKYGFNVWNYMNTKPTYYTSESYQDEIDFVSSDPQVAYVDEDGDVYGREVGTATITAYSVDDETVKAEFTVEVKPVPVTAITFSKSTYNLKVGKGYSMGDKDYRLLPSTHSAYANMEWTSSDEDVVTVSSDDGYLSANKVGTAKITLTIRNTDDSIVAKSFDVKVTENKLTGIAFKKSAYNVTLSSRQEYKELTLALTPVDANIEDYDLYVESSDPKVATASIGSSSNTVTVHAYEPGKATITVKSHTDAKLSASTEITVKPVLISSVKMAESKLNISYYEGGTNRTTIKTIISPSDAYCKATWTTTDASVAFVENGYYDDDDGREATLYVVGPGTCKIKVTVTDGTNTKTAQMTVTVKAAKVSKLTLDTTKATVYMIKGEENTLQLNAYDSKTDVMVPVSWKTSNKKVATVNAKGLVTFKKAGKVKITATTKDGNNTKKTCTLTIKQLKVTKVVPAKKTLSMKVGEEATLVVNLKPAKAYNKALSFKSSNKKVVTVDANGNLKAVKAGKAVITITAKDGSKKSAKVTITVKGTASNDEIAIDDETAVGTENNIELTLDGVDGIDDLFIDDEAVFEVNDTSALALD